MGNVLRPRKHTQKSSNKHHEPCRTLRRKRITPSQFVNNLNRFSVEFKSIYEKEKLSAPQADRGIGPVKYELKFHAGRPIKQTALTILNKLIKLEKHVGDLLLKLDLGIVCLFHKREDPEEWIPAAFRVGIRIAINK